MKLNAKIINWIAPPLRQNKTRQLHLTGDHEFNKLLRTFDFPLNIAVTFNQPDHIRFIVHHQEHFLFILRLAVPSIHNPDFVFLGESNAKWGLNQYITDRNQRNALLKNWFQNDLKKFLHYRKFSYLMIEELMNDETAAFLKEMGFISKWGYMALKLS
jgi:hypothetical protein